jgi:hypothetical protein
VVVALRAHTSAVMSAITTAVSPVLVGLAKTPKGGGWISSTTFVEYVTLFPRPEGGFSGTLGRPRMKMDRVYQASCIASGPERSEWLAQEVSGILDSLSVAGHRVCRFEPEGMPGPFQDPDTDPPIFVTPFLFRLTTTS